MSAYYDSGSGYDIVRIDAVSASAPVNTVAPAVTGTATAGQTLTTTDGTWTGSAPITYTYQWQYNDGTWNNIAGQTASTYQIQSVYVGDTIRCVVTGTNALGNSSANSNATAAVSDPAAFVNDTMTGVDTTLLSAHTGETGATWTKHTSYTGTMQLASNRLRCTDTTLSAYYASGSPVSVDYTVSANFYCVDSTAASVMAIAARVNTAANTMYVARYNNDGVGWAIFKIVAGASTLIGNTNATLTNGQTYALVFKVVGTSLTFTVDGVTKASGTDSAISAAGKVGVRGNCNTAYQFDSVSATDWYA